MQGNKEKNRIWEKEQELEQEIRSHKTGIITAFQMAWPSVMESFFVALAGMVDSLMVSSLGPYAVAAVGLTTQPKFIGMCLFIALSVAVSALVARRKGEERRREGNQVLLMALLVTLLMGTLISICCVVFAEPFMRWAGAKEDTLGPSVQYFRIIMGGMLFQIITLSINAAQRGAGNTKIAMRTNVTANVVNMIGNYLLIQGNLGFPALGIQGAALATVFGTVVACTMAIFSISTPKAFVSLPYIWKEKVRPLFSTLKSILHISNTVFVEQILMRIGFMAVAVMAADMGTNDFAAHQVGMNIMSLSFSFGDGFQAAAVALIGQSLGRRDEEQARFYGKTCRYMGLAVSLVLSVLYLTLGRTLYGLFFQEAEIIEAGLGIVRMIVVIVFLQISQVIYMGCLRGAGDVRYTMMASTISVTLVRPLTSYLFCYPLGMGLIGIWMGVLADQLSRYFFASLRFRSGKWTKITI